MRFQGECIETEVVWPIASLSPSIRIYPPSLFLLPFNLNLLDAPLPSDSEASNATIATEVPVRVPAEASIILHPSFGKVQRVEEIEIHRGIDEADVEYPHLLAGSTVALVDADAGGRRLGGYDRREREVYRIFDKLAMA
jgi:hypothetical protein